MFNKRQFFSIGVLLFLLGPIFSQDIDYGVVVIYNSSSQTNYDPTVPEDGTFQWNSLGTWGAGGYFNYDLSNKFNSGTAINFQQKGYKELAQVIYVPGGSVNYENLKNTLNYLCVDLKLNYKLFNSTSLAGLIGLGLEYGYLLDYNIESDFVPINSFYPVNQYQDNWNTHNLSMIPVVSLLFESSTSLEFGLNGSLIPVLQTETLIVRDWIWTFRLNQSIPAIFR